LAPAESIDGLVRRYQELLRRKLSEPPPDEELRMALEALYTVVWQPVEDALHGATNLLIAPDGALHLVSFATLQKRGRFLAEGNAIQYVSGARGLLKQPAEASNHRMEIFADADFDHVSLVDSIKDSWAAKFLDHLVFRWDRSFFQNDFGPLPGTAKEAAALKESVSAHGIEVSLHQRRDASKRTLMQVRHPLILHLATHGFFFTNALTGTNAGLQIKTSQLLEKLSANRPYEPSLFGSGIALAGANQTIKTAPQPDGTRNGPDGLVFTAELATLDLDGTWLVVLSTCDTGVGDIVGGEDVLAVRRAMVEAGARNVLSALWPVSDVYSPEFMQEFYSAALPSGDAAAAFVKTQRRALLEAAGNTLWKRVRLAGPFVLSTAGAVQRPPLDGSARSSERR
jgi:CHAT domain-containing protein